MALLMRLPVAFSRLQRPLPFHPINWVKKTTRNVHDSYLPHWHVPHLPHLPHWHAAPLVVAISLDLLAPAHAQTTNAQQAVTELDSVTVQAAAVSVYTNNAPASVAGPMDLSLKETAQSVSVINEQRMRDQGLNTPNDVLRWVPGVNISSGAGQEGLSANARGFSLNNIMVDGQSLGGSGSIGSDLSLYESVEVLRGAAGLFAGSGNDGSPAGAISLRRKRPTRQWQAMTQLSAGSWDNYQATLDVSGPLVSSGRLRGRGIVSRVDRKFDYDFAYRKSSTAGLTLELDATDSTVLSVGGDMEKRDYLSGQRRSAFRNWDGSDPGNHYHGRSNVMPWGGVQRDSYSSFVKLEHFFSNYWNLKLNYTRQHYSSDSEYTNISTNYDGDTEQPYHYLSSSWGRSRNWSAAFSADLTGDFEWFNREHKFVLGYNYQSNWSRSVRTPSLAQRQKEGWYYGYNWDDYRQFIDFDDLSYTDLPYRPTLMDESRIRLSKPIRQTGFYTNLRLQLLDSLYLTTGARWSTYQRRGTDDTFNNPRKITGAYEQKGIFTPFAALSLDVGQRHTVHFSYAEIFKPQNSYDLNGDIVDPLTGENWEIGLKSEWNDGLLTSSVNLYQLDRVNGTWKAIDSPCPIVMERWGIEASCNVADDHQRTIGTDFELMGQITPNWDVSVGASWLKTKYLRWTNSYGKTSSSEGKSWSRNNPTKQLKIWSMHRLTDRLRAGIGLRAQDRTWNDMGGPGRNGHLGLTSNTRNKTRPSFRLHRPGYTVFNAMLAYDINQTWQAQLNIENLTNKDYLHSFESTYVVMNEPRSFNFSLIGRFR